MVVVRLMANPNGAQGDSHSRREPLPQDARRGDSAGLTCLGHQPVMKYHGFRTNFALVALDIGEVDITLRVQGNAVDPIELARLAGRNGRLLQWHAQQYLAFVFSFMTTWSGGGRTSQPSVPSFF